MVQNLKPRFQHPNPPQRIITWGILQFKTAWSILDADLLAMIKSSI